MLLNQFVKAFKINYFNRHIVTSINNLLFIIAKG